MTEATENTTQDLQQVEKTPKEIYEALWWSYEVQLSNWEKVEQKRLTEEYNISYKDDLPWEVKITLDWFTAECLFKQVMLAMNDFQSDFQNLQASYKNIWSLLWSFCDIIRSPIAHKVKEEYADELKKMTDDLAKLKKDTLEKNNAKTTEEQKKNHK